MVNKSIFKRFYFERNETFVSVFHRLVHILSRISCSLTEMKKKHIFVLKSKWLLKCCKANKNVSTINGRMWTMWTEISSRWIIKNENAIIAKRIYIEINSDIQKYKLWKLCARQRNYNDVMRHIISLPRLNVQATQLCVCVLEWVELWKTFLTLIRALISVKKRKNSIEKA